MKTNEMKIGAKRSGMFPVVKDEEVGRKLSFFEDRENDVGRSPESFDPSRHPFGSASEACNLEPPTAVLRVSGRGQISEASQQLTQTGALHPDEFGSTRFTPDFLKDFVLRSERVASAESSAESYDHKDFIPEPYLL